MLISHYLIFKNNYVVPNINYGMLCYVTISTFSWYVSMIGFMEKNKDDLVVVVMMMMKTMMTRLRLV